MAGNDLGKLWFEMGVRDKVTGAMAEAIKEAQRLGKAIDDVADKNANNLTRALYRISEMAQRTIGAIRQGNAMGLDTSKLKEGLRQMLAVRRQLLNLSKDGSLAMSTKPLNKLLGAEFEHMMVTIRQVTIAQENLNKAMARGNARAAAQATREQTKELQAQARAQEQLLRTYDRVTDAMGRQRRAASQLRNIMSDYFSVYAGMNLVRELITVGGEFETQKVALQTILGDMRQGQEIYSQIQSLAIESPMSFRELAGYTKQLAAFNIPYEELYDTTKRLADISAGVGVDMGRLILAYGQVRSATVLRGQELRQFTEAGIPMVDALAKKFNELNGTMVTSADVLNKLIPTKQIPFEMVRDVLKEMTDEGGRFYNMQLTLADTLAGKWSNLRDAWEVMLAGIANGQTLTGQFLKAAVSGVTELTKSLDALLPVVAAVGLGFGAKRALGWAGNQLGVSVRGVTQGLETAKEAARQKALQKQLLQGTDSLTAAERQLLSAKKLVTAEDYRLLAASGRLNVNQLAILYNQKRIGVATLGHLQAVGAITREQAAQILQARTRLGLLRQQSAAVARQAGQAIGSAVMGMVKDPFTWISVGLAGIMAIQSAVSETEAMMENMAEGVNQRFKSLNETINELRKAGTPTSNSGLKQGSDTILGALKGNVADYEGIEKQALAIKDLGERYEYLNEVLEQTQKAYQWLAINSGTIGGLLDSTGGLQTSQGFWHGVGSALKFDWISDSLKDDMEDWDEYNAKLQSATVNLGKYEAEIKSAIDNVAKMFPELRKQLDGKSMEEQLRIIADSGYWDALGYKMNNWTVNAQDAIDSWKNARTELAEAGNDVEDGAEKLTKGIGRILENMAKERGQTVKEFVKDNEVMVSTMIDNIVRGFNTGSEQIQNRIIDLVRQVVGLKKEYDEIGNRLQVKAPSQYDQQSKLGKQMMHNVIEEYGQGVITVAEINKIAGTTEDARSTSEALDELKKKVQSLKQEYDSINAVYGENHARTKAIKEELDRYTKVAKANGLTMDDLYKKQKYGYNKPDNGKDAWLEQMKERMNLLPKFISLYEKYRDTMGADAAREKVNEDVQFASLRAIGITDPTDEVGAWKTLIGQMNKAKTTADRRKAIEDATVKLYDAQADALVRQNRVLNEQATQALDKLNKQWEMYRKWLDATGSAEIAGTVAFGSRTDYTNEAEQLRAEVERLLEERNRTDGTDKTYTVEGVLSMTGTELDEAFGKAGQGAEALREKIDALKEAQQKLNEETLNGLLEMIEQSKGYDAQLADIDRRLEKQIELINQTFSAPQTRQFYTDEATNTANRERSGILFKKFQEESDWVTIFDDLDRVSTATITGMIDRIEEFSKTAGLSVEEVKKLREALSKLRDKALERNPFGGIADSLRRANAIRSYLGNNRPNGTNATYTVTEKQGARMGLQAGEYTRAQLESALKGAETDMVNSIDGISKAFDELQGVLDPVISLFDALGESGGLTDALGLISGALGSASSTGSSLSNLMGMSVGKDKTLGSVLGIKNAGMWGAVAGAGLSIVTGLFKLHDKSLQKEIEASEERQREMENLTDNIKTVLERTMGGVYRYRASDTDLADFEKYLETYRGLGGDTKYRYGYIQDDTREQIKEAQKSRSYYDSYIASLMVQRDELQHQMDSERKKKDNDASKIADYEQQIADLDDQIKYVAEDMANELYGIDFKDWANDLSQALVDAWASGMDAAEAYRDKVSEILRDVGVNIITQKYLEPLLEDYMNKFMTYFDANNGVIGQEGINILSQMYEAADKAAGLVDGFLDGLEQVANKYGETIKDSSTSSGTNAISGITEDEAGLLISYVNAIRADVSRGIMYDQRIAEELLPQVINVLAVHQATLKAIEANTGRSADAAERLSDLLNSVASGTKKLSVVTYVKS